MQKPLLGASACLLGQEVRYNGDHKREDWLTDSLSRYVKWHAVCPEVAMGLGVPRETMRLERKSKAGSVRLISNKHKVDLTDLARETSQQLVESLPAKLNGYILKSKSPSCGLERVKIYGSKGIPTMDGMGIFAQELTRRFPNLPVIEEGRLKAPQYRENFVTRVFAHHAVMNLPGKVAAVQKHHESYKFVIQSHDEVALRQLGRIAANSKKNSPSQVVKDYQSTFLKALEKLPTVGKRTNVIQHIYGFVKDKATDRERASFLKNLEQYRKGRLPYVALVTLTRHLIEKHGSSYIEKQRFFSPYPEDLALFHRV